MNVKKFDFIIGDRASGKKQYELVNKYINELHHIINDYHNGWLSFEEYKQKSTEIKNIIKLLNGGK